MKCPFCGHRFRDPLEKCAGCPLQSRCKVLCCPNCGYELERDSTLARWAKKLLKVKGVEYDAK